MSNQVMILEDGSEINLVHFQYRVDGVNGNMRTDSDWRIACTPSLTILHSHPRRGYPIARSEDPRAVNCPICQKTELFKIALAQNPMPWRAA